MTMLLPVQVTFRNLDQAVTLEELVQKEAAKLEHFYDRISSCRVVVERPQRADSSKLYHVRIRLGLPEGELVVKHTPTLHGALQDEQVERSHREADVVLTHKTPERAIREAFDEMRRRLQDYRRKQEEAVKTPHVMDQATVTEILPEERYGFLATAAASIFTRRAFSMVISTASVQAIECGSPRRWVKKGRRRAR
jgi:ribosome-associated translation inhibitor RaiA